MILDDVDSRPGSATSLLRTTIGAVVRDLGGAVTVGRIIRLMNAVGVSEAHARTAVSRVKSKGILVPERIDGQAGYRLTRDATAMLARGDGRIFTFRRMRDGDPWCLISFSLPEKLRAERHQLRRRLSGIGCGTVSTGLWISPGFLAAEVEAIFDELRLRRFATLFETSTPQPADTMRDAAARWWDLERIAALHRGFLEATRGLADADFDSVASGAAGAVVSDPTVRDSSASDPATSNPAGRDSSARAFAGWIRTLDEWRAIPYLDPGLPPSLLPADWPGAESLDRFETLIARFATPGRHFALAADR